MALNLSAKELEALLTFINNSAPGGFDQASPAASAERKLRAELTAKRQEEE